MAAVAERKNNTAGVVRLEQVRKGQSLWMDAWMRLRRKPSLLPAGSP